MTVREQSRRDRRLSFLALCFSLLISTTVFGALSTEGSGDHDHPWSSPTGGSSNRFYCPHDASRNLGGTEWDAEIKGDPSFLMAVGSDGTVYCVERYDWIRVIALGKGGSVKWESNYGLDILMGPSILPDGRIVVMGHDSGTEMSTLLVLEEDGTASWTRSFNGYSVFFPVADENGGILTGTEIDDDHLSLTYLTSSNEIRWNVKLTFSYGYTDYGQPAIGTDGSVYISVLSGDDILYCIGPNGTIKWEYKGNGVSGEPPLITHEGDIVTTDHDEIVCLSSEGIVLWTYDPYRDLNSNMALSDDGYLYLHSGWGDLIVLDERTGAVVIERDAPELTKILISGDGTIFGYSDDELYAMEKDGSTRWQRNFWWNDLKDIALGPDGSLLVATEGGVLKIKGDNYSKPLVVGWIALVILSIGSLFVMVFFYRKWTSPPNPVLPLSVLGPGRVTRVRCTRCGNVFPVPDGIKYITCPRCGLVSKEIW